MKKLHAVILVGLATAGAQLLAAEIDLSKLPPPAEKKGLTYEKDIRPLFEASCFRCHGEREQKSGLRLDNLEATLKGNKEGKVILAGKSKESQLVIAISQLDPEKAMPPKPRQGQFGRGPGGRPGGPGGPPPNAPGAPGGAPKDGAAPQPPGGGRPGGGFGPPAKPLTAEQVGLVRAWIDQGAK